MVGVRVRDGAVVCSSWYKDQFCKKLPKLASTCNKCIDKLGSNEFKYNTAIATVALLVIARKTPVK